ncbi:MAG: cobalamin B12-binding domain-containing protein [Candidatus Omnitrophica bacterium]|nr:cobalamin B12-binding domain-containing protein [Candidatus Omnitrophota bacterium]
MKAEVMLINAPTVEIKEKHYEQPDMPRIGLAYLASFLRASGKCCCVVDAKYDRLKQGDVIEIIKRKNPKIIGVTAMTTELIDVADLVKKIKKICPKIITVIGGPHATALPKQTLEEFSVLDIACFGEGEQTMNELIDALDSNKSLHNIPGIAYKGHSGSIEQNGPRPFLENLDMLPSPAWDLFKPAKKYPVLGSRGCPFRCNFCMRVLGDHIRFRDPDLVVREMLNIYDRYKPFLFEFYDETFGVNKEKTDRILDGLIKSELNKKVKWHIQTRVDIVNQDLLFKMKMAGCEWVGFGIESGNEGILRCTNKNISKEKAKKAIEMAKKAGISTGSFFILGHPDENRGTARDTIDFAMALNTDTVSFGIMTPYPGTDIARMAKNREGGYKLLSKNWSDYNKQTGNVLELQGLTNDELLRMQFIGYLKFYLLKPSITKIKNLLSFVDLFSIVKIFFKRIFKWKN